MTQQHEAINADHCAAQWLCTVSPTPPHSSQRSNMHCPSPAAEQWRPLLLNVQELAMVKDMQKRQNLKQMHRNVGKKIKVIHMRVLYIIHSNLVKSLIIRFNPSSHELSLHFSIEEVWSRSLQGCIGERWKFVPRRFPPFTLPFPHSLNQHTGLPLAVASPSIWLV